MLKTIEDISTTKKRLRLEIPAEAVEKEIVAAMEGVRAKVKLPGFRQGKAPLSLIEKRFGKDVEAEAIEKLISDSYTGAVKEAGITPVAGPVVEEAPEFKRNNPLSMTVTVEVRPKLENLKYEGVSIKDIPVEVKEEEIEVTLKRLQEEKTAYEPSEEEITHGDVAIIDIKTVDKSGSPFELAGHLLKVGTDYLPVEVSEALKGKKKGAELNVTAGFPEGFHMPELAGTSPEMSISVKEVKKASPPALDDDLAKEIGFEGIAALNAHIKEELLKSKQNTVKKIQKAEALKKVIEENEFEAPESLVERELENLLEGAKAQAGQAGQTGFDPEAAKKELRPMAVRNIKASLLIDMIGEKEGVTVTEEDMKKEILSLSGRLRLNPENVMKYFVARDGSLEGLRHSVFEEKVLEVLIGKAKVEAEVGGNK